MHRFNAFYRNVNTINWKIFPIHVGIYKSEKIKQAFWRNKNPEDFKEIWKDVTLRVIVKDNGGKKHCLPICWFQTVGLDIFERASENACVEIEDWGFSVHFLLGFEENSIYTLHLCFR